MYAADVAERQRMDKDRLLTKLFGPKYDLLYSPEYDRRVSKDDFYRLPRDSVDIKDYRKLIEEGFHKDQDYMNILATIGDTWRYLKRVIAWTIPGLHATFSHKELEPYGIKARPHEQGHSVLMREMGPHSEHQVDQLIADPSRNYKLGLVRLSY